LIIKDCFGFLRNKGWKQAKHSEITISHIGGHRITAGIGGKEGDRN
jgi:hypothetical protein